LTDRTCCTAGVNFTNMFTRSFYEQRSQKRKNSVKSSASFCIFVDEMEPWGQFYQRSMSSFCAHRSWKRKKTDNLTVFFAPLGSGVNFIIFFTSSLCACRFVLILLAFSVECKSWKLGFKFKVVLSINLGIWWDWLGQNKNWQRISAFFQKVVEIDGRCQFHQHFMSSFLVQMCFAQLLFINILALQFFG